MVPNATRHEEGEAPWFGQWDYAKAPLNKAVLIDWIDQGLDFFGCDESTPRKMFGGDHLKLQSSGLTNVDLHSLDYAKLHDEFLEALLFEQTKKPSLTKDDLVLTAADLSVSASSSQSVYTSASSTYASNRVSGDDSTISTKKKNKRPRPLRLHRKVMPTLTKNQKIMPSPNKDEESSRKKERTKSPIKSLNQSPNRTFNKSSTTNSSNKISSNVESSTNIPSMDKPLSSKSKTSVNRYPSDASVPVSLDRLSHARLPSPILYIHPLCRMQKDKGKGEPVGSNICAKGREACLEKLQQKMELLTRVAFGEERKGSADMKRRPAKVSEFFPNFTETRSIIELRMGFLSMQYGVLLRWDTQKTGKISLVVLRKMCHEKFYERTVKNPQRRPMNFFDPTMESPALAVRNVIGNHAILQRPDGMEVALLEPPYRVVRPDVFAPTVLSVSLLYATGLTRKSSWTVQLCYDGKTESLQLAWDKEQGCFAAKTKSVATLKQEIPMPSSLDLTPLDIRLFEQKLRRKSRRRCVADMTAPLSGLEAHPTSRKAAPSQMKVACSHDPEAVLTLSVLLESDYANWLRSELEARRREEVNNFVWKAPFRVVDAVYDEEENDSESVWEWICSAC